MLNSFEAFFKKKDFWWDYDSQDQDPTQTKMQQLKAFYPDFFTGEHPNFEMLREGLKAYSHKNPSAASKKSLDLFKNLFPFPWRCIRTSLRAHDDFAKLKAEYGDKLTAHGIEEAKGGPYNLLMMALTNKVKSPSAYWGSLVDGAPNISPVPHGPYYLIYEIKGWKDKERAPNFIDFDEVEFVLVPFPEIKQEVLSLAYKMLENGLLQKNQVEQVENKILDMSGFYSLLRENLAKTSTKREASAIEEVESLEPKRKRQRIKLKDNKIESETQDDSSPIVSLPESSLPTQDVGANYLPGSSFLLRLSQISSDDESALSHDISAHSRDAESSHGSPSGHKSHKPRS